MKQLAIILIFMATIINTVLGSTCPAIKGGSLASILSMPKDMEAWYKKKCNLLQPFSQANMNAVISCKDQFVAPCMQKIANKLWTDVIGCLNSAKAMTPNGICNSQTMSSVGACFEKNIVPKHKTSDLMKLATGNVGLIMDRVKQLKACVDKLKK